MNVDLILMMMLEKFLM
ncbi:hypothetical protein GQ600_5651 [Phytophthora cactorum]|nr:hypothetical protein GQ600_12371 [Phytophthora cactorum]KAF1791694.1 hypothetical protein GQ600_5651 [Phytophthora cactorum]